MPLIAARPPVASPLCPAPFRSTPRGDPRQMPGIAEHQTPEQCRSQAAQVPGASRRSGDPTWCWLSGARVYELDSGPET
jgi:hypothetical protein